MLAVLAGSAHTHTIAINIQAAQPTAAARARWQSQAIFVLRAAGECESAISGDTKVGHGMVGMLSLP
jgi:hypothetical protein